MDDEDLGFDNLKLKGVIGFNGKIPRSFNVHPDRQHVIFALGCTVVIEEINTKKQDFLQGHTNNIVCLDVSKNGAMIASGQITYMGYKVYPDDQMFYCGTSTGDILGINMQSAILQVISPEKNKFSLGITSITTMPNSTILIGSGEGIIQEFQVKYTRDRQKCLPSLVKSNNCSELFATCSYQDVRIFNTRSQQELLRINIPNMTCYCIDLLADGTAILSGWDDSKIRAFYPETGRLMYSIHNAHKKGVTALCSTSTCNRIISGGGEGHVRVWDIKEIRPKNDRNQGLKRCGPHRLHRAGADAGIPESTFVTVLVAAMHEHTNAVSCIQMSKDDKSCVSASADSTCIVWCLETFRRKQIIFSNTLFRCICYHPTECQVITSGTDRKIGYWEVFDGSLIRQLDGSRSGSVNGMDITKDGTTFVTSGDDKIVKVWKYNEGEVTHVGLGHTSAVTRLRISPDQRSVITVSEDGAIYIWDMP